MDRDDLSFLERIFSRPVDQIGQNVLIVNQSKSGNLNSNYQNIRVINDAQYGLSRSRNIAIKNSAGTLLWILDDDCVIKDNAISIITAAFNDFPYLLITFQTEVLETGKLYWDYPRASQRFDKRNILNTLSPEIVFSKELIDKDPVFDERFGLGAQFQEGENYIFLKNLENRFDKSGYFVNHTIVSHPATHSSMDVYSDRLIYARGALAQKDGKNIFLLARKYALFLIRKRFLKSGKSINKVIKMFESGAQDFIKTEI